VFLAYLKVISRHSPAYSETNDENLSQKKISSPVKIRTGYILILSRTADHCTGQWDGLQVTYAGHKNLKRVLETQTLNHENEINI
jgi:hypothetical protein